jgi:SAM-dependent methyltransferase
VWTSYGAENSYTDADASRKDEFVKAACTERRPRLVWDVGCNTGRHSRIAADVAAHVVAFDSDHGSVELLYRELRTVADGRILPLVIDAADPSPGLGWRNRERATLIERGRPDLVLALAVVHHLAITNNVPLREVVRWLADLGGAVVVEFPTREDPMVQQMLRGKRDGLHGDYDRGCFERWLGESFDVRRQVELASGTRVLYDATPRRQRGADL